MEDVSLRLEANLATVELWQRHRALCSGVIALLTLLAIAATVMVGAALAAAGTSEPATSAAKPSGELRLAMAGIGVMRPIPWQETPFSKGYFTLCTISWSVPTLMARCPRPMAPPRSRRCRPTA